MKQESASAATVILSITMQASSGGGNVYIDGKKVISQSGNIKYPIQSGAHVGAFDMTGQTGDHYSVIVTIDNGPQLFEMHGTIDQTGHAAGQKPFQV